MKQGWLSGQRTRVFLQAAGLALAVLLVFTGTAIADSVEGRLQAVLGKIEAMVTKLALDNDIDAQETEMLREDLAEVYRELTAIRAELAPPVPQDSPVDQAPDQTNASDTTAEDPAGPEVSAADSPEPDAEADWQAELWQTYPKAKAVISPPDAEFGGWQDHADINFRWGEYGQVIVEVANGYKAQWTINDAYHGNVNVSTQSQPDGDILIVVDDDLGQHQFLLQHGGLGPLLHQVVREQQPPVVPL